MKTFILFSVLALSSLTNCSEPSAVHTITLNGILVSEYEFRFIWCKLDRETYSDYDDSDYANTYNSNHHISRDHTFSAWIDEKYGRGRDFRLNGRRMSAFEIGRILIGWNESIPSAMDQAIA